MSETPSHTSTKKKKVLRWVLRILLGIILIPILVLILLQLNPVQDFVKIRAQKYLQKQLGTKVEIGSLRFQWWHQVKLGGVYVEDKKKQVLFSTASLQVNYNLWDILHNEIAISSLKWEDASINVYRPATDSAFNYQFIIDAFTSGEAKQDTLIEESNTTLSYNIGNISLNKIRLQFNDTLGGMLVSARWNMLRIIPKDVDPAKGIYNIEELTADSLVASFVQKYIPKPAVTPTPTADTSSTPLALAVSRLSLMNSQWLYSDEGSGFATSGNTKQIAFRNASIDLTKTWVLADELKIDRSNVQLDFNAAADKTPPIVDSIDTPNTWVVQAKNVNVDSLYFVMNDHTKPVQKQGIDYMHLGLLPVVLQASDIYYSSDSTSATLQHAFLKEKSGIVLHELKGKVKYTAAGAALQQLILQTHESKIDADVDLKVRDWATLADNLSQLQINANIRPTTVALKEGLYFAPSLANNPSMRPIMQKRLALNGVIRGTMESLQIPNFHAQDNQGTILDVQGTAQHVTDSKRIEVNLPKLRVQGTRSSLASWLPAGTLPTNIQLPNNLLLTGNVRGGMQRVHPNLFLNTSFGNAAITGDIAHFTDMKKISYDVEVKAQQLAVGKFLSDTTIGALNGNIVAKGYGTDPKQAKLDGDINIQSFTYNNYTYHNIALNAQLENSFYKATGFVRDSSLRTQFQAEGKIDTLQPRLSASLDVDKFDLYKTNFMAEPFTLKACLLAKVDNLAPRNLNGYVLIDRVQFAEKENIYSLDSILVRARTEDGLQHINFRSPFGYIAAKGAFNYQTFAQSAQELIQRHFTPVAQQVPYAPKESQWMTFTGQLEIPKSLRKFLPSLQMTKPVSLNGGFSTDSAKLAAHLFLPTLNYNEFNLDTLQADILADTTNMQAAIVLARMQHPQIPLERTTINANAKNGLLDWDLVINNSAKQPKYKLGGMLHYLDADSLLVSLKEELLLNKQKWTVSGDNKILIQSGAFTYANLGIQNGEQALEILTGPPSRPGALPDVTVNLRNFNLASITSLIEKDTALIAGIASGKLTAANLSDTSGMKVEGELNIDSMAFMGTKIGNLELTAGTVEKNTYRVNAHISGNENDITLFGTYGEMMDFDLALDKLNMASIEPFTFGSVTSLGGVTSGRLSIMGTVNKPVIQGKLHFEKVGGRVTMINNILTLPSEDIVFSRAGLRFNNFVVADSAQNEAVINGSIVTLNYRDYAFNLDLKAENMMVLGPKSPTDKEQWYWGPARIDANAKIRGTLDLPRVEMNVKLREKSEVTVMIPDNDPGLSDREGVVQFIDKDSPIDSSLLAKSDTAAKSVSTNIKGIVFSGDIEVNPDATMRIIIDPSNGDYLEVKGTATLNVTMDPSSKLSLTGRYEIEQGKYAMSLSQLIKREFDIQKGSSITWNGDPTSADVDIKARYTANPPAIDLISDQLTDGSTNRNRYNQKIPVYVYLKITGELLKPDIAFELDMPEKDQGVFDGAVYTRLKQINQVPSDLNKQVMGLLVLNKFISDNPFESLSSGGSTVEDIARKSVSKILSQQLNSLAGSLIKGVDINFDLQSNDDYSTGERREQTNLNVDVSKKLFSDRLTVSVGSNIALSGPAATQNASSIIGDVTIEYALTKDGRYRLRAYRKNLTEVILEGQNVETGVSFLLVMDYDEFREILRRRKENKAQRIRTK
ncbi:uncharacterized protein DUF490 [Chitinophaga skermanii]|uniref:Uncharacterized protein DUF490 n=1 Tax=Chitinophaga skermanii TaxID=331697 RepID=A0A327Q0G7_9BACT|nr:translocation/assembly module TamB [Chitinophaga skermanii]RAI97878.1 uncharacterized protein DUF490 [Chitinophaga skermanii]